MKSNEKSGISLILLIITIVVITILSVTAVLGLTNKNTILDAIKLVYMRDLDGFTTELELYHSKEYRKNNGRYERKLLQADDVSYTYNNEINITKSINEIIPSLGSNEKYKGEFEVVDGELIFIGSDTNQKDWALESGIVVATEPIITIIPPTETVVEKGIDIVYTIKFSSNIKFKTIDLTDKVEILDEEEVALSNQPDIIIGALTGKSSDLIRQLDLTIKTSNLDSGKYKIKIKSGAAENDYNLYNSKDTISSVGFDVNSVAIENPTIYITPSIWTNADITVTIAYSEELITKQYSFDGITWNTYEAPFTVAQNSTVYAKGMDDLLNETEVIEFIINNIDKVNPTITFGTNGGTFDSQVSTIISVSDINGSDINDSTLQYIWDAQNVTIPTSGWTSFINNSAITLTGDGTHYLWIKAGDNAGNIASIVSNAFILENAPVTTVKAVNTTFSGATTGFSYNNPVIPAGFVAVNTTDTNWNNLATDWDKGLVIQDANRNEFVWVPVDGTNVTYGKNFSYPSSYGASASNSVDDALPTGVTSEADQITKYKGFYIARFETGNASGVWVIRKSATVWNNISYTNSRTKAHGMYTTTFVKSGVVTGSQWDTTMKWIANMANPQKSVTDSRAWGNYTNSISPANIIGYGSLKKTGYSEFWKAKNIYDLAGNGWEWTNEQHSYTCIGRGGNYGDNGATDPASYRYRSFLKSYSNVNLVFRVALYIL